MPRSPGRIQAVTLDVGGTLIAPHPSVGEVYAAAAAKHGVLCVSPAVLEGRFHAAWNRARPFQHHRDEWQRIVDAVFEGLAPEAPSRSGLFDRIYDAFAEPNAWRIFEDTLPTLEALAAMGLDLAIVSNWDDRLRPLLQTLRLDRYFNGIVVSCEAGFTKPSPVIFEEALRQLGRPASAVLHVGDSLREDFAGAIGAGLSALHLRRDATTRDLQIRSLEEIPAWIRCQ